MRAIILHMSKKPILRLELLFRSGYYYPNTHKSENRCSGGRDPDGIWVPVTLIWQEGPTDLHVHFAGKDSKPYCPYYSAVCGDYIAPDPYSDDGLIRAYSFLVTSCEAQVSTLNMASDEYIRRLKRIWESPNKPASRKARKEIHDYEYALSAERGISRIA